MAVVSSPSSSQIEKTAVAKKRARYRLSAHAPKLHQNWCKTPCTFREYVRARLDIRPFQFTSTMTSATVTATDTFNLKFNDAVKYALERVGKAGMVLLVRDITATQAVLSGTT